MTSQHNDLLNQDIDETETQEWLEALAAVIENDGPERAHYLLERMVERTRRAGAHLPYQATTAYVNSIAPENEHPHPGNAALESRIRALIRWNALAMVVRANRNEDALGGHIASFASAATLYDVGFNHFWHAPTDDHGGDLVYIQGHSSPGVYARAYLEGRIDEDQLDNFRREVDGKGLSSYPHPWLMPDFWQLPTVSMGLGPLMAIYQARFLKYLHNRELVETAKRKVWAFMGDGEMDEPESLGAISLAGREKLDNLVFVVNCNLQRLDGPVRGNGKIIQELEGVFRGAGWNVIKVIWGSYWDPLLAKDKDGLLRKRMDEAVDGDYQNYKAHGGAYTREHFFGKYPELEEMVANMSDKDIWRLNRGGHDPHKIFAAYHEASKAEGRPTVILAKTVKGYGMGEAGEGQNITHQQKKMGTEAVRYFRDRFNVPVPDDKLEEVPFIRPPEDSPEIKYLKAQREKLGGHLPARHHTAESLEIPELKAFDAVLKGTGDREVSTTMAFVRVLSVLVRDKKLGKRVVPIVADETRTFGMEGMFRQLGIYAAEGQKYEPVDHDQLMFYKEDKKGQILQEGITEAGAFSSWIAAATSYANSGIPMIPFFIYYSMFGFQRIGDLAWAAGDMRARGFLLGGTSGRTTLNGEGLQHQDGHSHIQAALIPSCVAYDPTFAYEVAVILHDGLRRMYVEQEDVYFYITLLNENYSHPDMPEGCEEGVLKGLYALRDVQPKKKAKAHVNLMGCGSILNESIAAADLLAEHFDVESTLWSATSINELRRDALACERYNRLHPDSKKPRKPWISQCLEANDSPLIAATDYMKLFPDQIRAWVDRPFAVLGTDGYGRSDSRAMLRHFFEVDRYWIAFTAVSELAAAGKLPKTAIKQAIKAFNIDTDKADPVTV
jgi:pyruvate dehydrogenase E1 component